MSYFDDQEDAWFENGCRGNISDVDPFDVSDTVPHRPRNIPHNLPYPQNRSQKSRARKNARKRRRELGAAVGPCKIDDRQRLTGERRGSDPSGKTSI